MLQFKSKELKKDASRQLREGSRTVGSLILCKDLPAVQELFTKAHKETAEAAAVSKKYHELELIYEQSCVNGAPNDAVKAQMDAVKAQAAEHVAKAKAFRREAWDKYHGKDVLPITERTLDPEYQKKLDGNYETGINLGKLTNSEMRELRREMQMIFQDPAASLDPRQSVGKSIEEVYVINTCILHIKTSSKFKQRRNSSTHLHCTLRWFQNPCNYL